MRAVSIVATVLVLVMVGASLGVAIGNANAAKSSRDSYGYRYVDSNAPDPVVTFNWVEINATGTSTGLTGSLDYHGPYSVGFNFNFYGSTYSQFYVTTSGFISFGSGSYMWSNDPIPESWTPNNIIAPYWDYGTNYGGTIYYQTLGVAPDRQLVVEWENVSTLWTSSLLTYEIIMNETGDIWFQYLEVGTDYGSDATVGIENSTGTVGVQYSYETSSLSDNLAIRFSTGAVTIMPSQSGYGKPNDTVSYSLTVKNWQAVSDSFAISSTSVQGWSVSLLDSMDSPLTDTDGDTIPDTGSIAAGSAAVIHVTVDVPAVPAAAFETTTVTATSYANAAYTDNCTLTTDVAGAWFSPPHSESTPDSDSNGEFNWLVVDVSINVFTSGWYYVEGDLYTSAEGYLGYDSSSATLASGAQTLQLYYYGWLIRNAALDGPYHIDLYLYNSSWDLIDTGVYTTSAYTRTQFMDRPGVLSPPHSDVPVDTDSDGLYDYLDLLVNIDVHYAGMFQVNTYLYDSGGDYLYRTKEVYLDTGLQTVDFRYSAWDISREFTLDGQFHAYIYLYAMFEGSYTYMGYGSHWTESFVLANFERPAVLFLPSHMDYANDTDSDGYNEYLDIAVSVDVTVEGDYSIEGRLYTSGGTIDTVVNTTHLTVGIHTVDLMFPGWPIRSFGDIDYYDVDLVARSGSTVLDTDVYQTHVTYDYRDFDTAPGRFVPTPTDRVVDTNGDTFYEYLIAEIPVNVDVAGYYEVVATIERIWDIETRSNSTYLDVGTTTVEVQFSGWMIRDNGWDGPFYIYMYLYDSAGREMDYGYYYTAAYLYASFSSPPAHFGTPNEAYLYDADSDGLYEAMMVNATVVVDFNGTYLVQGYLYGPSLGWVVDAGNWSALEVGTRVVKLAFPSWMINLHGLDGTFNVRLYLYDANRNYLDYRSFTTSSYQNETFDPVVPRIASVWTAHAPAIDGRVTPGEWAGATTVSLSAEDTRNGVYGSMLLMNDATNLYIMFDAYGDTHEDTNDYAAIGFDTGNDGVRSNGHEDAFLLSARSPSATYHYTFSSTFSSWTTHCSPFDTTDPNHETLQGQAGFGPSDGYARDHRIYEYSIPLSLLNIVPGDVIGFLGRNWGYYGLCDYWNYTYSSWPIWFESTPTITQYGELRTASAPVVVQPPVTTASVSGTAGSMGWYLSQVAVGLSASGGSGGVNYTEYRLDGGSWTRYTAALTFTTDGVRTIEFRSVDFASQVETTKTLSVKIDTVAPATAATADHENFTLSATDATSGVGTVFYRIDGGAWQVYTGRVTVTGAGTHTVEYYSSDVAGNIEVTKSIEVKVKSAGGGLTSSTAMLIGVLIAAIVAAVAVILLVVKRRKGREPVHMVSAPGEMVPPAPPS